MINGLISQRPTRLTLPRVYHTYQRTNVQGDDFEYKAEYGETFNVPTSTIIGQLLATSTGSRIESSLQPKTAISAQTNSNRAFEHLPKAPRLHTEKYRSLS